VKSSELPQLWRERLEAEARECERAAEVAIRALDRMNCNSTSAEIAAFDEARRREAAALDEYLRVLTALHEWVLENGNAPT
jgi:hypothetical protein